MGHLYHGYVSHNQRVIVGLQPWWKDPMIFGISPWRVGTSHFARICQCQRSPLYKRSTFSAYRYHRYQKSSEIPHAQWHQGQYKNGHGLVHFPWGNAAIFRWRLGKKMPKKSVLASGSDLWWLDGSPKRNGSKRWPCQRWTIVINHGIRELSVFDECHLLVKYARGAIFSTIDYRSKRDIVQCRLPHTE